VEASIIGGTPPYSFTWSNNAIVNPIQNLCAGTYSITVTDATGTTASNSIILSAPPAITVVISETDPSGPGASDGALSAVVNGGTPDYTYQWSGPVTGNTASLLNIPAGGYLLVVTDDNGCQVTRFVSLGGAGDCYKGISIITPNSDGKNDFFIIDCVQNAQNHLYIFNRQGGLVYDTPNYQNNWIGVDNDEEYVPDGGYHWVLEVQGFGGTPELYKGTVTVLRTAD
jgi:gliding motility-associated-like protein